MAALTHNQIFCSFAIIFAFHTITLHGASHVSPIPARVVCAIGTVDGLPVLKPSVTPGAALPEGVGVVHGFWPSTEGSISVVTFTRPPKGLQKGVHIMPDYAQVARCMVQAFQQHAAYASMHDPSDATRIKDSIHSVCEQINDHFKQDGFKDRLYIQRLLIFMCSAGSAPILARAQRATSSTDVLPDRQAWWLYKIGSIDMQTVITL